MKIIILFLLSVSLLSSCTEVIIAPKYSEKEVVNLYGNEKDGSNFLAIEGKKVHYRISGQGPDMVLIHGTIDSLHTWDAMVPELEKKFRVIRFDIPGFGLSDPINLDGDMGEKSIQYMDKIFNKLELKKFHLVGNSLGGLLAWYYAYRFPKKVNKVVLLDAAAYPQSFPWFFDGSNPVYNSLIMAVGGVSIEPSIKIFGKYIPGLLGEGYDEGFVDAQLERVGKIFQSEGNIESYSVILNKEGEYDFSHHKFIKEIKAPLLIIYGDQDGVVPPDIQIPRWKVDRPNDEIILLKGVGHLPQWERPRDVNKMIFDFIGVD